MTSSTFWRQLAERAVKTFAQTLVALIGANAVAITDLDWPNLALVSATAALVSALTSLASASFGQPDSPSLVPVVQPSPAGLPTGPSQQAKADTAEPLTDYRPPGV